MTRLFLFWGAVNAALAVAMGAFGAHGLKQSIEPALLAVYQTGAQYHLFHALGLLLVGVIARARGDRLLAVSGWMLLAGMVLFSGSLYLLAITGERWLGAITPLGGTAFILAWLLLAVAAWRRSPGDA